MFTNFRCRWGVHYAAVIYKMGIGILASLQDSPWGPIFGILLVQFWSVLQYLVTRLFEESLHWGCIDLEGRIVLAFGFSFFLRIFNITLFLTLTPFEATWWTVALFDSLKTILDAGGVLDKIRKVVVRWLRGQPGKVARKLFGLLKDKSLLQGDRIFHLPSKCDAVGPENMKTVMHVIYASSMVFREILIHLIALVMLSVEFALVHTLPTVVPLWNYHHDEVSWLNRSGASSNARDLEMHLQIRVLGGFAVLVGLESLNAAVVYLLLAWDIHPLRQSTSEQDHDSAVKALRAHSLKRRSLIQEMATKRKRRARVSDVKPVGKDKLPDPPETGTNVVTNASRRDLADELSTLELLQRVVISKWDMNVFPTQILERHWREVLVLVAHGILRGIGGAAFMTFSKDMGLNYDRALYQNETFEYRVMKFEEFISAQISQNYSDASLVQNVQCIRDLSFCRVW